LQKEFYIYGMFDASCVIQLAFFCALTVSHARASPERVRGGRENVESKRSPDL